MMLMIVKHKKRGSEYVYEGDARLQTEVPLEDNAKLVVYRDLRTGELFARRMDEFNHDRFESLHAEGSHAVMSPVKKVGGDYSFEGVVVCRFVKLNRRSIRYVVEDNRGVLHVYNGRNLAAFNPLAEPAPVFPKTVAETHNAATEAASEIIKQLLVQHFENDAEIETVLNAAFKGIRDRIIQAMR